MKHARVPRYKYFLYLRKKNRIMNAVYNLKWLFAVIFIGALTFGISSCASDDYDAEVIKIAKFEMTGTFTGTATILTTFTKTNDGITTKTTGIQTLMSLPWMYEYDASRETNMEITIKSDKPGKPDEQIYITLYLNGKEVKRISLATDGIGEFQTTTVAFSTYQS